MAIADPSNDLSREAIEKLPTTLPVVPLRDSILFPRMVLPMAARRDGSLRALEQAVQNDKLVFLLTQRDREKHDVTPNDLYETGTVAKILQLYRTPDGGMQFIVQGLSRARVAEFKQLNPYMVAKFHIWPEEVERTTEIEALVREVTGQITRYSELGGGLPEEVTSAAGRVQEPGWLADLVAFLPELTTAERQEMLETVDVGSRLRLVGRLLNRQLEILEVKSKIHSELKQNMEKTQRDYMLREQLKAIQKELNESEGTESEQDELKRRIAEAGMPDDVQQKAEKELGRLQSMPQGSPETGIIRTYLDWLIGMPWTKETEDQLDIGKAADVLDAQHYGLQKVKDRILEHLAVRKLAPELRTPIICFVGPPGVGKTSLGKSIATALGREFVRISLGGIHDEAEIRGHRRTYIGALPGRIIQGMKNAGTRNPVFMLDEIDKVGADFRGDPTAALLEVLDPEQNNTFADHYLDVPYDLSKVMFITTANVLDTIPAPLRDRMEIIPIAGYAEDEKVEIAQRHVLVRQLKQHGLTPEQLTITPEAMQAIVRGYTRESGVRNLERELAQICRKAARKVADGATDPITITPADLKGYLGNKRFEHGVAEEADEVGLATGLAWTETGGDLITVEATVMPGQAGQTDLILTGQLGQVMQESARAAFSYVRSHARELGIDPAKFTNNVLHVHVPAGAIPKDGPSAGITMAVAIASALSGRPARRDVAMTGEVTLRGRVLPIGGLKEKTLAAHRAGIKTVLLPKQNEKDIDDLAAEVKRDVTLLPMDRMTEVLQQALVPGLVPTMAYQPAVAIAS
jgi:ATP-dependent Lon protease